jgi:predicted transcriptional regulator of viral defense system
MSSGSTSDRLLALVREAGIVRSGDVTRLGIPAEHLRRLFRRGLLVQPARGLYRLASHELSTHHSLAFVAKKMPHGIVCLLSALQFHNLTTQLPRQVWLAIDRRAWKPTAGGLPVRVVRFSGAALSEGVEEHTIEGVRVRITNPSRTVADCFKYRSKVWVDVALEALRDGYRTRQCTIDDLWTYARQLRVATVIRPYLESIV